MVLLGWVQIDTRHVVQGSYYLTLWPCAQPMTLPSPELEQRRRRAIMCGRQSFLIDRRFYRCQRVAAHRPRPASGAG